MIYTLGIASAALLVGVLLRKRIRVLGRAWIPATIIAGVLGMIFLNILRFAGTDISGISDASENLVNICFDLIIICMPFTMEKNKEQSKVLVRGGIQYAMLGVLSITMLMTLGILTAKLIQPVFGMDPKNVANFGLGFTMGPGQALVQGKLLEINGIENAYTIGMAFASIGFLVAFIFGLPFILVVLKKGKRSNREADLNEEMGIYPGNMQPAISLNETVSHSNVDTFTLHAAVVLGMLSAVTFIVKLLGNTGMGDSLVGIMEFLLCLVISLLVKGVLKLLKLDRLINSSIISRYVTIAEEYLIILAFFSVNLYALKVMIVPIVLLAVIGGIASVLLCYFLCRSSNYPAPMEQCVFCLGTFTGTIGSGLALLHVVDPEMKSPVWKQIPYGNAFSMLSLLPVSVVITLVSTGVISVGAEQIFMAVVFVLALIAYWFVFIRKTKKTSEKQ